MTTYAVVEHTPESSEPCRLRLRKWKEDSNMRDDQLWKLDSADNTADFPMNRREFITITGGGIFLFFIIGDLSVLAQQRPGRNLPSDFNAFLKIGEDGRVSCYTGKIEMGQGIYTSLAQMLADELDVSLDAVDMVMGDTDLCPWDMGTFGSMSTRFFGPALRAAGAEARRVLLDLASEQLKTDVENLTTEDGFVIDIKNKQNRVSYAQLAKGKHIERHVAPAAIKKPSEFKIISKPTLRRDAEEKVTGRAKYAGDIQIPGMLYAKILRPPAHGAKLIEADLSEAQQVKDVQIIREGDFIAVLHKYPDMAEAALLKIKAKYSKVESDIDDRNIFDHLLKVAPEGKVVVSDGNLQTGENGSKAIFEETYLNDYVAHSSIEPHTAVVKIEGNNATVWASTQTPFSAKEEVAKELDIPSQNVRVITPFVGGGFGGKSQKSSSCGSCASCKIKWKTGSGCVEQKRRILLRLFSTGCGGQNKIRHHGERQY